MNNPSSPTSCLGGAKSQVAGMDGGRIRTSLSICIVSHNADGAIRGGRDGFIGGVERQTSLLAKWLVQRGHTVSMVTWDEGGPAEETVGGVRLLKICRQDAGFPGLRFFHPKWTGLVATLKTAGADVYYHNCGECVTGQVAWWCKMNRRAFVFSAASDADCDRGLPELKSMRERVLYRYGLTHADRVIVQTPWQQERMRMGFGRDSEVIPMPCPGPGSTDFDLPDRARERVLWVGRVCRVKRPDRLVEVAKLCPEIEFDLVGPLGEDHVAQSAAQEARKLTNVTVHGPVSRACIDSFYRQTSMLCCTSDYEGFPNTFLEAWSHGLPVVSTVDPDGLIHRKGLGAIGSDPGELGQQIRTLLASEEAYRESSLRAREYYTLNHTIEAVLPRFETVLAEAAYAKRPATVMVTAGGKGQELRSPD